MNNGRCPKCNSNEIYCGSSAEGEGLTAGSYTVLIDIVSDKTQTTLWVNTFICQTCGFLEMHVVNRSDLAVLSQADGWKKIN